VSTISPLYLAVDLGTGSLRVSLYSLQHGVVAMKKKEISIDSMIDIDQIWSELAHLIRSIMKHATPAEIACIGISALLGWVPIDIDGVPAADAWTWMHQEKQSFNRFRDKIPADYNKRTGRRFTTELGVLKWAAMKENAPLSYERVQSFISLKDYLIYRLTGSICMDYTHAAYTGVFSIQDLAWDDSLLRLFDIEVDKMPKLHFSSDIVGVTTETAATLTGMNPGIPVICGGPDGSMAILGGGGVTTGVAVDVMGTTDVVFGVSEAPLHDEDRSLINNPHLLPGLWLTGGPMGMTSGTAKWFINQWHGVGEDVSQAMRAYEALANDCPAGSLGLLFIPSLTGERTPLWNESIRGSVIGLTQYHTNGHIYRALLEGNGYSLQNVFRRLEKLGFSFQQYIAIGGGTKNRLGLQIRADITGKRIVVPKEIEASTLGVAILCALAMRHFHDPVQAVSHMIKTDFVVEPRQDQQSVYEQQFRKYQHLLQCMSEYYSQN